MDLWQKNRLIDDQLARFTAGFSDANKPNGQITEVLRTIHENLFDERLNAERVKQLCLIGNHNISCRFKHIVGVGIHDYIEMKRVEAAKLLLQQTTIEISTIAFKLGYSYQESFSRAFRPRAGCSPKEYRLQVVHPK